MKKYRAMKMYNSYVRVTWFFAQKRVWLFFWSTITRYDSPYIRMFPTKQAVNDYVDKLNSPD